MSVILNVDSAQALSETTASAPRTINVSQSAELSLVLGGAVIQNANNTAQAYLDDAGGGGSIGGTIDSDGTNYRGTCQAHISSDATTWNLTINAT